MKFSIIIPTVNRSSSLEITINSLLSLDFPPQDYEILIVDNGSTDSTEQVTKTAIESNVERQIKYHFEPIPGLLSGRHRGAFESKGDILVYVDDDIEADRGWLQAISEAFEDSDTHLVGGKNLPKYQSSPPDWLDAFWYRDGALCQCFYLSLVDFGDRLAEIDPLYVWGLNFSIRKETLFELGGFNPDTVPKSLQRYQGDGDTGLAWKVKAAGYKVIYQPTALVYHIVPNDRLNLDYLKERMYFAGVSDSYTTIRRNGGIRFDWKTQAPFPQIKQLYRRIASRLSTDPDAEIKQRVREGWLNGYLFHQNEVLKDPELLKWILRDNYWDYRYGPFLSMRTADNSYVT
jgi:glucosyl-dolichyl phosphate glucuronosyltransferase